MLAGHLSAEEIRVSTALLFYFHQKGDCLVDSLRVRGLSFMEMEKNKAIERGLCWKSKCPI